MVNRLKRRVGVLNAVRGPGSTTKNFVQATMIALGSRTNQAKVLLIIAEVTECRQRSAKIFKEPCIHTVAVTVNRH